MWKLFYHILSVWHSVKLQIISVLKKIISLKKSLHLQWILLCVLFILDKMWVIFQSNFLGEFRAPHLHSWQSPSASCWCPGATLLFFFMNLLFNEAEDRVPDAKHSVFIKSSDDMRLVLKSVHYLRTESLQREGGPLWTDVPVQGVTGGIKSAARAAAVFSTSGCILQNKGFTLIIGNKY